MTEPHYCLAIVGLGPRGHYAFETFIQNLAEAGHPEDAKVVLFEESNQLGNGPVWDTSQSESNWSNVNERGLNLPERPEIRLGKTLIESFPDYNDWADVRTDDRSDAQTDIYPPRRDVGRYLSERFASLVQPALRSGLATLVTEGVNDVTLAGTGVSLTTENGNLFIADQVVLTVGHQSTQLDGQIEEWKAVTQNAASPKLFTAPYPVEHILNRLRGRNRTQVAIRGYGLATIDIARAIAEEFGSFTTQNPQTRAQTYTVDHDHVLTIVPFSLDGLPMGPKPLNGALDEQYKPSQATLEGLSKKLGDQKAQQAAQDETVLIDAMVPIVSETYRTLTQERRDAPTDAKELEQVIEGWMRDSTQKHDCILDTETDPREHLDALLGIAVGRAPVSLDYCIGQVWRHCHPVIYASLSHGKLSDEVLAKIIFLDESMKRYAFGPPAESLHQLGALHDAGVLNLNYLSDPDIAVSDAGWTLSNGSDEVHATVMIDAVLDSPKIMDVNSPLIKTLLDDGILMAVHDDLGVVTSSDAFIISDPDASIPVAVLGRLAKGTIIGVDSIHECFGSRTRDWAASAARRVRGAVVNQDPIR